LAAGHLAGGGVLSRKAVVVVIADKNRLVHRLPLASSPWNRWQRRVLTTGSDAIAAKGVPFYSSVIHDNAFFMHKMSLYLDLLLVFQKDINVSNGVA
jgi:hypothetical protein